MKKQEEKDIALGRFISLVLRHQPEVIGLMLDSNGYAPVDQLLSGLNKAGKRIDMADLERIVQENNKKRYCFNDDHTKIRANQGHSIPVDVELKQAVPPELLYHGTAERFLASIRKQGLTKQARLYVHLSKDYKTAVMVGERHGKPVVLTINAGKMHKDGLPFYLSENSVWLCDDIPSIYLQFPNETNEANEPNEDKY